MRAMIVDDEPVMVRYFMREAEAIPDLNVQGTFTAARDAIAYAKKNPVEVAFLDVAMPDMSGLELAVRLRELRPDILIVFVSAFDYIRDSNRIGGDYYLEKPYDRDMLELMMERLRLLARRQKKHIYIQTFGTFSVLKDGVPVPLTGKAKEILAYVVLFRGKEVSNQTIYTTIWEEKPYGQAEMTVYFHALKRLKKTLAENGIENLLISNARGQMLNTDIVDCDYYAWQDKKSDRHEQFNGTFLSEYSWSEPVLAEMLGNYLSAF